MPDQMQTASINYISRYTVLHALVIALQTEMLCIAVRLHWDQQFQSWGHVSQIIAANDTWKITKALKEMYEAHGRHSKLAEEATLGMRT